MGPLILILLLCAGLSCGLDIINQEERVPKSFNDNHENFMFATLPIQTEDDIVNQTEVPVSSWGGLYPQTSVSREVKPLDGVWSFRLSPKDDPDKGFRELWFEKPLSTTGTVIAMAVPSSYNEVTEDKNIREHVGWAWYDTQFYVPARWQDEKKRVVLRFGSVTYNSIIYLNGKAITSHLGGHLPIMADVTSSLMYSSKNLLTVAVNNTLTPETIPQGTIIFHNDLSRYPPGYFEQKYNFDFFNFAGIDRPVFLYTTPQTYVDNIRVITKVFNTQGSYSASIEYDITSQSPAGQDNASCSVFLVDANDTLVVNGSSCSGTLTVSQPQLWWPYLMDPIAGYQYTLWVRVTGSLDEIDEYPLKVGLREVAWNTSGVTINGRPLYIRGCGKHEDADIRGKGYDAALVVKDFALLKWLGANSFRTSHYPYAEEIMDRADAEGIMVIDESPAIGLSGFDPALRDRHIAVMEEFIMRDRNRPSVIMWSVGNEPKSSQLAADDYFRAVVNASKLADPTRPVTAVLSESVNSDLAAQWLDVIWVNRYFSWYSDTGHLEVIQRQTVTEFQEWHSKFQRPVGISEYGAGSIPGLHMGPSFTWSEEYQTELLLNNFKAFDDLRDQGFFMGEMIWNFADFLTPQEYNRPAMCMKGLFTRTRQPKMAAQVTRARYHDLAEWDNSCERRQGSTPDEDDSTSEELNGIFAIPAKDARLRAKEEESFSEFDYDDFEAKRKEGEVLDTRRGIVERSSEFLVQSQAQCLSDAAASRQTRVQAFAHVFGFGLA